MKTRDQHFEMENKDNQNEQDKHGTTVGGIEIDPSPTVEQFQGLPLESLTHNAVDLAIAEERDRIERTRRQIENEQD
ncbi:hypothetical protein [Lihuaxuella thermophila]|uniref:YfhD-like protein n=1 Tax=Lihuaxuella thermophila TaxID=1173111 RepID=A0A1H8CZW8_9BACL|nr:hypothetical protein [Lihuaxuella thermophila]SEN00570.1 hypothetical protein SAMN05444955_104214 [Lihuaxuella thermophila]